MKKHLLSALLLSGSFFLNQGVVVAEAFPEEFRNCFSSADALLVGLETQGYVDPVSLKGNHQSTRVEQSQQKEIAREDTLGFKPCFGSQNEESARKMEELLRAARQRREQVFKEFRESQRRAEEARQREEAAAAVQAEKLRKECEEHREEAARRLEELRGRCERLGKEYEEFQRRRAEQERQRQEAARAEKLRKEEERKRLVDALLAELRKEERQRQEAAAAARAEQERQRQRQEAAAAREQERKRREAAARAEKLRKCREPAAILGLSETIDWENIEGVEEVLEKVWQKVRKAYKGLAREYHPDKNVGKTPKEIKQAEETFKIIQNAYECFEGIYNKS